MPSPDNRPKSSPLRPRVSSSLEATGPHGQDGCISTGYGATATASSSCGIRRERPICREASTPVAWPARPIQRPRRSRRLLRGVAEMTSRNRTVRCVSNGLSLSPRPNSPILRSSSITGGSAASNPRSKAFGVSSHSSRYLLVAPFVLPHTRRDSGEPVMDLLGPLIISGSGVLVAAVAALAPACAMQRGGEGCLTRARHFA
jgi:hypothetical protein